MDGGARMLLVIFPALAMMAVMVGFVYMMIARGQRAGTATQVEVAQSEQGQVIDVPVRDAAWLMGRNKWFRVNESKFGHLKLYPQGIEYRVAGTHRVPYHGISEVDVPNARRPHYVTFHFTNQRRGVHFRLGNEGITRQLMWYLARANCPLTDRARSYVPR